MSQIDWFEKYNDNFDLIESALKESELWSIQAPSQEAMESTMPFAVDAMPFEQWLQFIFLPRMRQSLANGQLPPGPAQIFPIAEEVYKNNSSAKALLDALRKFDEISHVSHLH
ncbi:YqcC family protein [Kangiella sp. HZ709]|uniref:YqcC family protein n=1 Tax=Kangiella sp. HZ709 TaxID=2666328 RepID=UPI0012AF26F5|nr:YqcC family protein [Kangiella sp. HZ709]MRX27587.1 YqcC family protein [Kangiella sp. HZ709]